MNYFTVIGIHDNSGEVIAHHIKADGPHEAMAAVANNIQKLQGDFGLSDVQILGAIPGRHELTAACEDAGKAAYAVDLVD